MRRARVDPCRTIGPRQGEASPPYRSELIGSEEATSGRSFFEYVRGIHRQRCSAVSLLLASPVRWSTEV